MTDDGDHPGGADRKQRQVEDIVAGVPGESRLADPPLREVEIALRVLVGDDPRMLGDALERVELDARPSALGNVIGDHRQPGRVSDRQEVRLDAGLRRTVVVRRHCHDTVGPDSLRCLGRRDRVGRVIGPDPSHDGGAIPHRLEDGRKHGLVLRVSLGGRLACGAVDDETVVLQLVDEVHGELLGTVQVERAVGEERRDHRREHDAEGRLGRRGSGHGERLTRPYGATRPLAMKAACVSGIRRAHSSS